MRKYVLISIIVLLALSLYIAFTLLFSRLFVVTSRTPPPNTPTPVPTFTPSATPTTMIASLVTPVAPALTPTLTATPALPEPTFTSTPEPTATPAPAAPQVVAASPVNIRSGPGTNYSVVGSLPPNAPLTVTGRNAEGNWWQVRLPGDQAGWVAASVVEAQNGTEVAIVQAPPPPPPPPPTNTPVPPEPARPQYQFEPTGWYSDRNLGLTRFLGTITDANGNPVNGVAVQAQCGGYSVISNPSGPVGGWRTNDGADDPPGFYDITIDKRPIPCQWGLTVVYTEDGENVLQRLSETVEIEVTVDESIVTANWRKNW